MVQLYPAQFVNSFSCSLTGKHPYTLRLKEMDDIPKRLFPIPQYYAER